MIKNIKASVIYLTDKNWKNILLLNVKKSNFDARETGNILILKDKNKINFCIIRRKEVCHDMDYVYIHINISGVKSATDLSTTIFYMQTNILPIKSIFKSIFIDNITYSIDLQRQINLSKLSLLKKVKLNFEKFPGAFLKVDKGTFVIFQSGKCVLLGCKNIPDIHTSLNDFYKALEKLNI